MLSDESKRKQYDTHGDVSSRRGNPYQDIRDWGDQFGFRKSSLKGDNISKSIRLKFMEAAKGVTKDISIDYPKSCKDCNGSGADKGTELDTCDACNGQGKVASQHQFIQYIQTCQRCAGRGFSIKTKCKPCSGSGVTHKIEKLSVKIPPGVESGMSIRLTGKGMDSQYEGNNEPGDLYLSIVVSQHPTLGRSGLNVTSEKHIGYIDAVLGVSVSVNTIHGSVSMKIPQGTQPGSVLKISKKGVISGKKEGDHLVKVQIDIPVDISKDESILLEKIRKLREDKK